MADGSGPATVIYVHGAGNQRGEQYLKNAFDQALFGRSGDSVVARYAQVYWKPDALESLGPDEEVLDLIATQNAPPSVLADQVLAQIAPHDGFESLGDEEADRKAKELVTAYFERADQLAPPPDPVLEALPNWLFRKLAAKASADVAAYLFKGWAAEMREPVIETFRRVADPIVVIAHSLGSIVAYDVLCRPEFADRDIRLLVTAGSPLGIANVQDGLNDGQGPATLPTPIPAWVNVADPDDLVPLLGHTLADKYAAPPPIHDEPDVDNPADNNHDLTGYLGLQALRVRVLQAVAGMSAAV